MDVFTYTFGESILFKNLLKISHLGFIELMYTPYKIGYTVYVYNIVEGRFWKIK
jgi:hypothetical protein